MAYSINIIHPSIEPFTKDELDKYIGLIDGDAHITEHKLSRFFQNYPKFLTIGGYYNIAREVVIFNPLSKEIRTKFRLDFLRKRIGDIYWDILELKSPNVPLSIKRGKPADFQSKIRGGVKQLRNYKNFLDDDSNRLNFEQKTDVRVNYHRQRRWLESLVLKGTILFVVVS